jgi:dsRNA-specific ribonuclease
MRINHEESGAVYEIREQKGSFTLTDSSTGRSSVFKESYEALWGAIELIRNSSLDKLNEDDLKVISKHAQVALSSIPKSLIPALKREKINRTYYDQTFLKLLSSYRGGKETIVVSNKTNFIVHHELAHLVRAFMGTKLTIPTARI